MKKNKGFTLVELITVIVVIAVISLIAIRNVSSKINSSKNKAYDIQVNNIKAAAKKYMLENTDDDKYHLNTTCITIKMLQNKGYLEKGNIKNPKEGKNFDVNKNYVKAEYDFDKSQYVYEFTDSCENKNVIPVSETILKNNPIKIINKEDGLYETTDSYVFRGANPNNYINFNNKKWRIVSIDKETMMIKIIDLSDNQKQISENGIIKDLNDDFETGTTYNTNREKINTNSKWNSNVIKELDSSLTIKSVEKQSNSFNTISLLTLGEYVDASLDKDCYKTNNCTSYLLTGKTYWLLNQTNDNNQWYVNNNKLESTTTDSKLYNVYPCLYLKLNTEISSGNGTIETPYELK